MKMLGVVLTGGKGSRLNPVTFFINKTLLPVGNKPMIYYPISTLVKSGIKRILVVTGGEFSDQVIRMVGYLKKDFPGIVFEFTKQRGPNGMPDAIGYAEPFVGRDPIMVIAGDNLFEGNYGKYLRKFTKGEISFLREAPDPSRFGCPLYDNRNRIIDIIEKPLKPQSNRAIIGPHIFDNKVFSFIKELKPSKRGELEIVDLHKRYLGLGELLLIKVHDFWADVGTFESLTKTSFRVLNKET